MNMRQLVGCAGIAMLLHVQALRAEIVHFSNPAPGQPGHYLWEPPAGAFAGWIDITRSPGEQTNLANGNSVGYMLVVWFAGGKGGQQSFAPPGGAHVAVEGVWVKSLALGESVHEQLYSEGGTYAQEGGGYPDIYSLFPANEISYIGVQTPTGNYGWIAVERNYFGFILHEWAYETVSGAPIYAGQIPVPGTLSLLTLAAILGSSRKRRFK